MEQKKGFFEKLKGTRPIATQTALASKATAEGIAGVVALATGLSAGPALPIVATVIVVAAACAKIYAQNKKLRKLFIRSSKICDKIREILTKIDAINKTQEIKIDLSMVIEDLNKISEIIARIAGPDTIRTINESTKNQVPIEQSKGIFARVKRMLVPGSAIASFREKLVNLSLSFSIVQAELVLILEDPINQLIAAVAAKAVPGPLTININVLKNMEETAKEGVPTTEEDPSGGRRRTRRHRKNNRRTYKN